MTSVIIAAHNEENVIGRCLDRLLAGAEPGEIEVIVVANGCADGTAAVAAKRAGVRVVEVIEANKAVALNAGDDAASTFPRVYLDADIAVTTEDVRVLRDALLLPRHDRNATSTPLAAVPSRRLDLEGRPLLVRGYFAVSRRVPAFHDGLFGRGMIGLAEEGRARFDRFPNLVADDLFLDSLFTPEEKLQVTSIATTIATPRRTRDLVRRLVRVRRGNTTMRRAAQDGQVQVTVRTAERWSWLTHVVIPHPWLAPAAFAYVGITLLAEVLARRSTDRPAWGQDRSTRDIPDSASRSSEGPQE